MDLKVLATVFTAIFIAELGDKTQLATLLFASGEGASRMTIFLGAAAALVLTSAIGVLAGGLLAGFVNPKLMQYAAGAGFVAIGLWTLATA